MTYELFKIYLLQKRRNFRWATFIAGAYLLILFWLFLFIGYEEGGGESLDVLQIDRPWSMIKPWCLGIIIVDFISTWLFKHDRGIMDDYVKTKPIAESSWNRFLLSANLIDFNNWFFPLLLAPVCFFLLPWYVAIIAILTLFSTCYINGLSIMELRKAKGWEYKAGVWTILFFYILAAIFLPIWAANAATIIVLYYYLFHLRRYNESKISMSSVKSVTRMSYISLQFLVIMRSKRVRSMMFIGLIFIGCTYLVGRNIGEDGMRDFVVWEYIFMGIFFSPMMFGSLGFGVEANYFHGLESKPVNVQTLLETKYYTQAILSVITSTLTIPVIFVFGISPWMILSIAIYVIGFMNLFSLAACLYGKRIDLFANGFMNMQGANWTFNLYTLAPILPMLLWFALWGLLCDELNILALITAALGLVGLISHKIVIRWLATLFYKNKYKLLERYTS